MNELAHTRMNSPTKASKRTLVHIKSFDFRDFKECLIVPFTQVLQQIDMIGAVEHIITRLRTVTRKNIILNNDDLRIVSFDFIMTHIT